MPWGNRPNQFDNVGVPRTIIHSFGDTSYNHERDEEGAAGKGTDPREPFTDHDPDSDAVYVCFKCGHSASCEPCQIAGDEIVPTCPDCCGLETFEKKTISIFEGE